MDGITVSVIMPAYNCAHMIADSLDSALAQQIPLEVIVLNDCSPDDLDSAMEPYLSDPRVLYLKNDRNLGVAETRNRGVAMARGDYIAFLDSDDIWAPDKLQKQLKRLEETGCVLCSTARELMTPDGDLTGYIIPVSTEFTYADIRLHNQINCSSVLLRTEVAREFPMHHDDCHEDYLMWLEVLEKYGKGCAVNEPLLKYRLTTTGKSGKKLHSARMTFRTYRRKGYSLARSALCFVSYAFHGAKKYFFWYARKERV